MIDAQILKKTTNVNKLRYVFKQIDSLFAKEDIYKTIRKDEINNFLNKSQISLMEHVCSVYNLEYEKDGYFSIPVRLHFFLFMEKLITSFINSNVVFTANDFNQFCINTKSVIDTYIYGCANNLYKGKNKISRYQDILDSILNSNEIIIIKRIYNNVNSK